MILITLLDKIDSYICSYLGLEQDNPKASGVKLVKNKLMVQHTSPFKRHAMISDWNNFCDFNARPSEMLGRVAGRAIANQLVVSFKQPKIKMNDHA